jgi:LPS-assembly lipoprotein
MKKPFAALLIAHVLLLGSCGFHLQGQQQLPAVLATTYIEAQDRQSDFVQSLRRNLLASGAQLAPAAAEATASLHILQDQVTRKVLSVSAFNTPREYELVYTVRFKVSGNNQQQIAEQEVSLSRDYTFDERSLLAKENEEDVLQQALADDLAVIVMRRLASL